MCTGLFPSSRAHHPIRFKRPWVPETTPPGARCPRPWHPLPPKVADLRCFFGSAMFTKATLDKVGAATCGVRKTCLELPTGSRVSQHLGGPGAHGDLTGSRDPQEKVGQFLFKKKRSATLFRDSFSPWPNA